MIAGFGGGLTTNSQTNNNFFTSTFLTALQNILQAYYQTANIGVSNPNGNPVSRTEAESSESILSNNGICTVVHAEDEITVNAAPALPVVVVPAIYALYNNFPPLLIPIINAMVAAGVTQEMIVQYKLYFFKRLNPATGIVYTNAEVVAISGWTLAQVTSIYNYENFINTFSIPDMCKAFSLTVRNTSAGGQYIRIGHAPSFNAPIMGMLLRPGDVWLINGFNIALNAIADNNGALLSRFAMRTP
jgi:hypothetical protein